MNHDSIKRMLELVRNNSFYSAVQGDAAATSGSAPSLWDSIMRRDDVQAGISYATNQLKNVSFHCLNLLTNCVSIKLNIQNF